MSAIATGKEKNRKSHVQGASCVGRIDRYEILGGGERGNSAIMTAEIVGLLIRLNPLIDGWHATDCNIRVCCCCSSRNQYFERGT